ncbi:MAG: tetratricopeptide repeat protein [Geminicoccaceae bacterium]
MQLDDPRGVAVQCSTAASIDRFEAALNDVLAFRGDPVGRIEAAIAEDPDLVLGHALRAQIFAFSLQPGFKSKAEVSLAAAAPLEAAAPDRERLHLEAARAWLAGNLDRSTACFDALLDQNPRDLMALMFGHQADFFAGHTTALRTRPERSVRDWPKDVPGYGFVLGMHAFGLEEAGEYGTAEALGREAVDRNPLDVWAIHAVGHVLEMQGRDEEGIGWYRSREADWAEGSFFAVHNAWHMALYHLDREEPAEALAVYDRLIAPGPRSIVLNLCDAAALLWRLHLGGVDVGPRWTALADLFAPQAQRATHVFNDVHAALAFAGAGRDVDGATLLVRLGTVAHAPGQYGAMVAGIGLPAAEAILAFGRGDYGTSTDTLLAARGELALMTGSLAQRDVLTMTLIEAALRDGRFSLARDLLQPRLAAKPGSARIARDLARAR